VWHPKALLIEPEVIVDVAVEVTDAVWDVEAVNEADVVWDDVRVAVKDEDCVSVADEDAEVASVTVSVDEAVVDFENEGEVVTLEVAEVETVVDMVLDTDPVAELDKVLVSVVKMDDVAVEVTLVVALLVAVV
jgi:hypothetical protein